MEKVEVNQKLLSEIATKKLGYPRGSTIPKFKKQLKKLGYRFRKHVNMESFCQQYPKETKELVLEFYRKSTIVSDKSFYILCLIHKGNIELVEMLMNEWKKYQSESIQVSGICNTLSELLYITKDIKNKRKYIKYLYGSNERDWLGNYKLDIMKICGEYQLEKAINYFVNTIQTKTGSLYNTALSALRKYENQERFHEIYKMCPYDERELISDIEKQYIEKEKQQLKNGNFEKESIIFSFLTDLKSKLDENISSENIQNFCQEHPKETEKIVLKYYKKSILHSDKMFFLECLKNETNIHLFSFLIKELEKYQNRGNELENAILTIQLFLIYSSDISLKDKYISLLQDENMYYNLGCIINICSKLKIEEAESYILEIAKDKKSVFCAEALQYLCYCKNVKKYQEIFKMYSMSPYDDVREFAKMGMSIIERKK